MRGRIVKMLTEWADSCSLEPSSRIFELNKNTRVFLYKEPGVFYCPAGASCARGSLFFYKLRSRIKRSLFDLIIKRANVSVGFNDALFTCII